MIEEFDVNHSPISGVNLIEASAGTGKTFTIVGIYLRLLLEKQLPVEKILVVTFTEAATAELKERIATMMRQALHALEAGTTNEEFFQTLFQRLNPQQALPQLRQALLEFDEAAIFTIHGFCRRMLKDFAFETQAHFDPELIPNQDHLIEELTKDYWREQTYHASPDYSLAFLSVCKSPAELAKEFKKTLPRPKLQFLPEKEWEPQALFEQAQRHYQTLKSLWETSRNEIISLLESHKIWNKRLLPLYCGKADDYFAADAFLEKYEDLEKFTTAEIRRKAKGEVPHHPFFSQCDAFLSTAGPLVSTILLTYFEWAKIQLKQRKDTLNLQSFDDLLSDLHQALYGDSGEDLSQKIQQRFSVALIDEFQDTDPIQYEIFKKLFEQQDLFLIGDPKQSIYNFRGADIFAYLQAQKEASRQFTLKTNWRSDRKLVEAVNTIFSPLEHPFVNKEIPYLPSKGAQANEDCSLFIHQEGGVPLKIWFLQESLKKQEARQRIAQSTASEITHLLNLGYAGEAIIKEKAEARPVHPKDIAVLVRTHQEAEQMRQVLAQRKIPCVLKTQINIFHTPEFQDILTVAYGVADYTNPSLVKAAMLTDLMGYTGTRLFQTMQDDTKWEAIIQRFYDYHQQWKALGFYRMMRQFLRQESVRSRLLSQPNGERRLTNVLHVLELMHQAESEHSLSLSGLLRWAILTLHAPEETQEEHLIRLETDAEALTILTVHASKGLEFPIVFCPFSWGSKQVKDIFFHDNQGRLIWDLDKQEAHKLLAKEEVRAEEVRLVYVALTRAKYCCYVAWGNINQTQDSPLAYLFQKEDSWGYLKTLEHRSQGNILVTDSLPDNADEFLGAKPVEGNLPCRKFEKPLRQDWGISSFSALTHKTSEVKEEQDHDQHQDPEEPLPEEEQVPSFSGEEEPNVFNLPKGANTGNCFHEILEYLNFQESDAASIEKLVRDKLRKYNFDSQWESVAFTMMQAVCQQSISLSHFPGQTLRLSDLPPHQTVKEMPFYFPIERFTAQALQDVVRQHQRHENHEALLRVLKQLEFRTLKGFMKGYLDMVFCYQDRYYILDWKTNHLGHQLQDYAPPFLKKNVEAHRYNLQYYLYAVALHKYLRLRIPDYNFQRHFGGVYYFYLRGLQGREDDHGVFYDPLQDSAALIAHWETVFHGEEV